ncbi:hypothetical protein V1512DRAFT_106375 [Lipomyces arxii]|uniref:uncharacterized protein n=1 Tax=Lipomyces arxii TaxID=56418 RepID=UPI0034CFBFB5
MEGSDGDLEEYPLSEASLENINSEGIDTDHETEDHRSLSPDVPGFTELSGRIAETDGESVASGDQASARRCNERYKQLFNYEMREFLYPTFDSLSPAGHDLEGAISISSGTESENQRVDTENTDSEIISPLPNLQPSTVGNSGTYWTSKEKELFFEYLRRRSRHDPSGISRGVGTKTVVECAEYISELETALAKKQRTSRRRMKRMRMKWKRLMKKIPAAREMPRKWIRMEEAESRKLEKIVFYTERNEEASLWRHGHPRIPVDFSARYDYSDEIRRVAGMVDTYCLNLVSQATYDLSEVESIDSIMRRFDPSFEFLDVERLMDISLRLFYSQVKLPRTVVRHLKRHSMQTSAVQSLYELMVRYLRRLISTSLVVTQTRLAVEQAAMFHRRNVVHSHDVKAGLEMIGAQVDYRQFLKNFRDQNGAVTIREPFRAGEVDMNRVKTLLRMREQNRKRVRKS